MPQPAYCTKIATRLSRTYTDRHGLKDLVREVLNIDLSKQQQSSDWGSASLSEAQLAYAASDVLHLHALRERLDAMLAREGRNELAQACFDFLPTRAKLDRGRWAAEDIFAHSYTETIGSASRGRFRTVSFTLATLFPNFVTRGPGGRVRHSPGQ